MLKMKHRRRVIRQLAARSRTEPGSFYDDWIIIENIPDRAYGYELAFPLGHRVRDGVLACAYKQGIRHRERSQRLGHRARRPYVRP